jgi:hypothetical protein
MSTNSNPSGFRTLSPEETDAVSGGTIFVTLSGGRISTIGGGFGETSASGNPMKFPADFNLETFQAQMAALAAWLEAGAPFPQFELDAPIQPSETAPPIMVSPAPSAGGESAPMPTGAGGWDPNLHMH